MNSRYRTAKGLLNYQQLLAIVPLSKTSIWRLQKLGKFPMHLKVGEKNNYWRVADIEAWMNGLAPPANLPEDRPDDDRSG